MTAFQRRRLRLLAACCSQSVVKPLEQVKGLERMLRNRGVRP